MKKKLIEVALPLDAINKASAREKSIRHGHPSTLHLWWARRPLAAARAVIFAQMVDDPSAYVDVLRAELEHRLHRRIESQGRQRSRLAGQLALHLLDVVRIDVRVSKRDHQVADGQARRLGDHPGQQRVGGDVERQAQEEVTAALVEAARQAALRHVELEERVAGRERHLGNFCRIPGTYDKPARVWVLADLLDHAGQLVDLSLLAVSRCNVGLDRKVLIRALFAW